ncbi:MAG: L-alanine exporter AlaE [Candidatus Woesearchaeota archaeon]|jgi:hypothetical protein
MIQTLDDIVGHESSLQSPIVTNRFQRVKAAVVDTFEGIIYSIVTGTPLDFASGLTPLEVVYSRATSIPVNVLTTAPYVGWREFLYRKLHVTSESPKYAVYGVELLAYNTNQVPLHGLIVAMSTYFANGEVNWNSTFLGMGLMGGCSVVSCIVTKLYQDQIVRKLFGVRKPIDGGAYCSDNLPS